MAELGKISLEGVEELLADLDKYDKSIQVQVAHEIRASAQTITRNAIRNAPIDQGALRRGISYREISKMVYELISGAAYSAFREFGTKSKVRISNPELVPFAQQFKGVKAGGKQNFKQMIFEWAKRVGIPKEAWYAVFLSILKFGTKPHPFFFPAYYAEIPQLRKRLEQILNKTRP